MSYFLKEKYVTVLEIKMTNTVLFIFYKRKN